MSDEAKPDPLVFKGVCSEGILKGKEIEGKLDLKVIVTSAKAKEAPAPKKSEWEPVIFWVLFAFMANLIVGDPAGMRKKYSSPQRSHSHQQMLNQSGEQSLLPKNTSASLSDG
ncbi:hypothetical protein C7B69_16340 [filamentous cyanobacterium Phorm 46]|nr:hypothetical protein C7B69_16340 [filamentous cyanobacterium Phorm 46]PSB51618.1 hypothetical protein C7B67_10150 [filamentous cyanobacterium Phorm 6]